MSRRSIRTGLHSRQQLSGRSANTPDSRNKEEEPSYQPATKVSIRNQGRTIFSLPLTMAAANSLLLLAVLLLSQFPQSANSISDRELDAAISTLRSLGYTLGNPITASNLCFDLLRPNSSHTLFAPSDSALFPPPPPRPPNTFFHPPCPNPRFPLPTVLPHRDIARRRQPPDTDFVTAGSVDVILPGIFYGQDIAVHGSPASSSSTATRPAANPFLSQDRPISVSLRTRPPIRLRSRLRLRLPPRSSS